VHDPSWLVHYRDCPWYRPAKNKVGKVAAEYRRDGVKIKNVGRPVTPHERVVEAVSRIGGSA